MAGGWTPLISVNSVCQEGRDLTLVGVNEFLAVLDLFNEVNPKKRLDRGLADFIGDGLSFLFGLSTEKELQAAKSRVVNSEHMELNIIQSQKHLATIVNDQQLQLANLQYTQERLQNHTSTSVYELKKLSLERQPKPKKFSNSQFSSA